MARASGGGGGGGLEWVGMYAPNKLGEGVTNGKVRLIYRIEKLGIFVDFFLGY